MFISIIYLSIFLYLSYILPRLVPKKKALVKDLSANTEENAGQEVDLHTSARSVGSNRIFGG